MFSVLSALIKQFKKHGGAPKHYGKVPERSNGLDCKSSASASEVRILPFPQKASQVGIHCKIVLQNGVVPRCKNIDKSLWFVRGWTVESIRDSTNVTTEIIWML